MSSFRDLVAIALLTAACSKNAASSAEGNAARAASAPAPAPSPGDSNNPDYLSLTLDCTRASTRPSGKASVLSRAVSYEDFGARAPVRPAQQTTRRESGPLEGASTTPTSEARAEIYRLAIEALNHLPISPELATPETEQCQLQIYRATLELDTHVNVPSTHPVLAGLVRSLAPLLPNQP